MNESETMILGCLFDDPSLIFKLSVHENQFFDGMNRRVFRAMQVCSDRRVAIDYISIHDIDPEIDLGYLITLRDKVPSSANWKFYEERMIQEYQRHKLASLGRILAEINNTDDPSEFIESAEKELLELGTNSQTRKVMRIGEALSSAIDLIQERYNLKGKIPGIGTGLHGLDSMIGGFQPDRYIIIGARPSDGKSALALNMLCNIAITQGIAAGLISAESSNNEIVTRAISSVGRISGNKIMTGMLSRADFTSLMDTGEKMQHCPLYLYDAPNIRFTELKSVARQMVTVHKIQALFIDYVQIVQWEDSRLAIHEQVAAVSRGLKQLARELKIPIIGLSQLKRDSEGREPEMADLDYSKQLEQDADALILIYHPRRKPDEEEKPSLLLVKKNRDGAKGVVKVNFIREYVRFYEVEHE